MSLTTQELLIKIEAEGLKRGIPSKRVKIIVKILSYLPRCLLIAIVIIGKYVVEWIQGKQYLLKWTYQFPCKNGLNKQNTNPTNEIIISLTTIPSRLRYIPYVLGSLMRQTRKPDRIILYLDQTKFVDKKLPYFLRKYQKYGVEVIYCEDIGPHTKYYYAMQSYPHSIIITVDDDVIYPTHMVDKLYTSYKKHPKSVSCGRAHHMTFDSDGNIKSYNEWDGEYDKCIDRPSMFLVPTGIGGVLYPPHCLYKDVFDKELIKYLAYYVDDIWLKFMEILHGTPVVLVDKYRPYQGVNPTKLQKNALCNTNVLQGRNDVHIQNLLAYYDKELNGSIYNTLWELENKIRDE